MKIGNILLVGLVVVALILTLTSRPFIPSQAIVPILPSGPFVDVRGQGLITPEAHVEALGYSTERLPLYAQSIMGLPTVSFITTTRPLGISLLWWLVFIALIVANLFFVRARYDDVREITWVDYINDGYLLLAIGLVVLLLFLGTQYSQYQFALFYTAMLIAAITLIEKMIEKLEWVRDFKLGLSTDNGIFVFFGVHPTVKAFMIFSGVFVIGLFVVFGDMYVGQPTYSMGDGSFGKLTQLIPVIPEDLLLFRVLPLMMMVLITGVATKAWGIIRDNNPAISISEAKSRYPRFFITTVVIALVITVSFTGLVVWPSYHQSAYGRQAEWYASSCPAQPVCPGSCSLGCGLTVEQAKAPMVNSVSNFGLIGAVVTLATGSSIPVDIYHAYHNWGSV